MPSDATPAAPSAPRRQREDAAAAAEVEHGRAFERAVACQAVQPPQAQRGRGMRAGPERQAGIQPHHRGAGCIGAWGQLAVPGHDPGAGAELQRLVRVHPRPFPVLVVDLAEADAGPRQGRVETLQCRQQQQRIGIAGEQRRQRDAVPQGGLPHARFEDGVLVVAVGVGIEQRHRERAHVLERPFETRLVVAAALHGQFEERHPPSLTQISRGACTDRRLPRRSPRRRAPCSSHACWPPWCRLRTAGWTARSS